jgi:hypothetical protein
LHGGTVEARNTDTGLGAEFIVRLGCPTGADSSRHAGTGPGCREADENSGRG